MLAQTRSFALLGIDALPVRVEVDVVPGLPLFTVVGLPDNAVRESRNRVASAVANAGFEFPLRRITVNLAPAGLRKEGAAFDLPIALGILAATGQVPLGACAAWASVGELSLTGELRPVRGVLSVAIAHRAAGGAGLLVPRGSLAEAQLVPDCGVRGAETLAEAVALVRGARGRPGRGTEPPTAGGGAGATPIAAEAGADEDLDLVDVRGQVQAKRAIEIAAAGGHNVLLEGPPGAGKSMLARRLPGILPSLAPEEALETTRIHSVAGALRPDRPVVLARPFRRPHHTASAAALVGGGPLARPGEVSLAHNGVLFLDELPEFARPALEALRQPLEEGRVSVARARIVVSYPARFTLVAAMNPCPCGDATHPARSCRCLEADVRRYRARVSGPLLDRIDIHVEVPPVAVAELGGAGERLARESPAARERVRAARDRQLARYSGLALHANAQLRGAAAWRTLGLSGEAEVLLRHAATRLCLSARGYHRTLRVARTIADLEGDDGVTRRHVAEALQYRGPGVSGGAPAREEPEQRRRAFARSFREKGWDGVENS